MKRYKKLRLLFVEREVTQNYVAQQIGMGTSTMSARMSGAQPWTSWEIIRIGELLGIPPEEYHRYFFEKAAGARS